MIPASTSGICIRPLLGANVVALLDELDQPRDECAAIPAGWQWSQLARIGFISLRNDADGALLASFVSMKMIPAEYGSSHTHEVRPWHEIKSGFTHFAEGDVGLAKITPCFDNGKSTIFRRLTSGLGAGTTELHIVRPLLNQHRRSPGSAGEAVEV